MEKTCFQTEKEVRVVPVIKNVSEELVAIGKVDDAEGKVLIDTGAQASLIKRDASRAPLAKPEVILKGISGQILKTYGQQTLELTLKPGVKVPGTFVVSNLPKGYLAVIGCDIMKRGKGSLDVETGLLKLFGKHIWLNRLLAGECVPDPGRKEGRLDRESGPTVDPPQRSCREGTLRDSNIPRSPERFVYCMEKTVIPARSEKILRGKLSKFGSQEAPTEGSEVVVEPIALTTQGVYLARTYTKVRSNRCWLKAVNTSMEDVTWENNTKIGLLDEVPEVPEVPEPAGKRRLLLLADSHGRALQEQLAERLPSDLEVSVKFFPNGKLKHIVSSSKKEISTMTSQDIVILMGGTNDIGNQSPWLLTLHQSFMALPTKWKTRLVVMSIPDRHDVNLKRELNNANGLLERLVERTILQDRGDISFCNIGTRLSRQMYTKNGLHLNEEGKIVLSQLLRTVALEDHDELSARINLIELCDEREFETNLEDKLSHLDVESRVAVKGVLLKYKSSFAYNDSQLLGCTSAVTHQIHTGDNPPVYKKAYRVPFHQKPVLDNLIKEQLEQGIIKESHSPWASPVVLVPKKSPDGTPKWRFCVDFRSLNALTAADVYPLPNITETLDSLGGCKIFSTLDLKSGYHQIRMDEASQSKTAFNVPGGHFEYTRMPFGLSTAPATFQRLMDSVLMGLKGENCLVYLDDIILYSADLGTHLQALDQVLSRLKSVNLSVQLSKCHFVVDEVDYLGHKVSKRGVEPDSSKVMAVRDYPVPKCVREVRSFLGVAGYYRRFIENFAKLGKPLFDLTKQNTTFNWTPACQTAFDTLKEKLLTAPVLVFPNFQKPFILATDASNQAIGAVLSQEIDGEEHPVAYASRTLFPAEKNYSTTEQEMLALVWSTKYFRCYLLGRPFKVITDHSALRWMLSLKEPSSRLMRWSLRLAEFDYVVEHKPGKKHTNADGLSRAVRVTQRKDVLPVVDLPLLREHQNTDLHCQDLKRGKCFLMSPEKILYRVSGGQKKIVVPETLKEAVIRLNHDLPTAGHAAVAKTLERVHEKFW